MKENRKKNERTEKKTRKSTKRRNNRINSFKITSTYQIIIHSYRYEFNMQSSYFDRNMLQNWQMLILISCRRMSKSRSCQTHFRVEYMQHAFDLLSTCFLIYFRHVFWFTFDMLFDLFLTCFLIYFWHAFWFIFDILLIYLRHAFWFTFDMLLIYFRHAFDLLSTCIKTCWSQDIFDLTRHQ